MAIIKEKNTKTKDAATRSSVSSQAGLIMPTARIKKMLMANSNIKRCSLNGVICIAATMEYITSELLEVCTLKAQEAKKNTIKNRHIYLGAKADKELFNIVLGNCAFIRESGFTTDNVMPIAKKSKAGKSQIEENKKE